MKDILRELFDYQRFEGNRRLVALIERAAFSHGESLSDEDLEYVNAAGDIDATRIGKEEKGRDGNE
ncbi:MAG: hypothetical protein DBX39_05315 [Bacillota bacterium]|nr:MAG: hypothetical protein DBX39_05315 [Bacillota bacterium]